MRNITSFAAAGLLLIPLAAGAQQASQKPQPLPTTTLPDLGANGTAYFGVAVNDITGDGARLQRYRQYQDGPNVDHFRFDRQGATWSFKSKADHVGWSDQAFTGTFESRGKLKASFTWDQIPLFISSDTQTPYQATSAGVLRLDDTMRAATEAGRMTMANFASVASLRKVDAYRHTAAFSLGYNATRELNLNMNVSQSRQKGTMPWGGTFGFNDDIEIAAPIDRRTTDVNAGLEWAGTRGLVRVGYDGSWFTNNIPTLEWDNPLKLTDSTGATNYQNGLGGSRGRAAMPPDSTLQGITTAGSLKLAEATRVTANFTVGDWRQNAALLPLTINSAVPETPLPRATAEANARTLAMNYTFTSRPVSGLWLNAGYRYYDFDNRTPVFLAPITVTFDQTVAAGRPTEALGYKRGNANVEVSVVPLTFTALRMGYQRNTSDRTYRVFERTTEDVYRASADTTLSRFVMVRASAERSKRRGSGLDEEVLLEAGEQLDMRHYDVADRDRNTVTGLVQITPHKWVGFSASVSTGKDNYLDSGFGLQDADSHAYSVAADVGSPDRISGTLSYTNERFTSLQNSRYVSVPGSEQVTDPARDWTTDQGDQTHTIGASVDLLKLVPRTQIRLSFDGSRSTATYVYRTAAGWPVAPLLPLPRIHNEIREAMADVRYAFTRRVALGFLYEFEDYTVDDFAQSDTTLNRLDTTGSLFMGYLYRPYTFSSAGVRLICTW